MLQKSKSKTIAKFKYLALVPIMLMMLTYVACSDDKTAEEIEVQTNTADDEALKAALWEEIKAMDEKGAGFQEISKKFLVEENAHIKTKEAYYRMQTFMKMIHQKTVEREKAAGTYDENSNNPFQSILDQDYDEYVAKKQTEPQVQKRTLEELDGEEVPFAVIEEVPVFPGCESLNSNEEQKECMTKNISEYVNKNFNTNLGKELGLSGVNRIIVQFKIDKFGNVVRARARAPHPALEEEAIRVINSIPQMQPGKQKGEEVGVMYSLPIVFQVSE